MHPYAKPLPVFAGVLSQLRPTMLSSAFDT
jgi:hypothetical protein